MSGPNLIISHPPYEAAALVKPVALALGRDSAEVRMRLLSPFPEIWGICEGEGDARSLVERLAGVGVTVWALPSDRLAAGPAPFPVREFGLSDAALMIRGGEGPISMTLAWEKVALLVIVQEVLTVSVTAGPSGEEKAIQKRMGRLKMVLNLAAPGLGSVVGKIAGAATGKEKGAPPRRVATTKRFFLDLFGESETGPVRARFIEDAVNYAGLGAKKDLASVRNWQVLLAELKARATSARVDERAVRNAPHEPHPWLAVSGTMPRLHPVDLHPALVYFAMREGLPPPAPGSPGGRVDSRLRGNDGGLGRPGAPAGENGSAPPPLTHCPACRASVESGSDECARCGVIFAKWFARLSGGRFA